MSEVLRPIPFGQLVEWMLSEYAADGAVFGVKRQSFYRRESEPDVEVFDTSLGSPLGAAAGPNTQLAQNILTAYLTGLRVIELKTVQTMDGEELRNCINRPCIYAQKEGYNCEWSTELTVQQAFDEYVKGWFLVHVAAKEFLITQEKDFLFNMSVGYDFDGITSEKIDGYIEGLKDASDTNIFKACKTYLLEHVNDFKHLKEEDIELIGADISNSITLSTLHGCPPEEIEKIAAYFLEEKELHTYIKLNPTLLGYDFSREILDQMGYDAIDFDHTHFDQDLKYEDAVPMIKRLMTLAKKDKLAFGAKITNTFPVRANGTLPSEFMYMSGKALYPLSIHVAKMLSDDFRGDLPISYSGGADAFNVRDIVAVGIKPVTVATTILKPGGYARAKQMSEACESVRDLSKIDVKALKKLATSVASDHHYVFDSSIKGYKKNDQPLPLTDCFMAPCRETGCPINQQIPVYLAYAAAEDYTRAFEVIVNDNVLPSVTGEICNHNCQTACNRVDYEAPLNIRMVKKYSAEQAQNEYIERLVPADIKTEKKVCVIGAGPAGLACAAYLRRNGVGATVYEKEGVPMGVVGHVVPQFRIDQKLIDRDVRMIEAYGVQIELNSSQDLDIKAIKKDYDYVVIATGAHGAGFNPLKEGKAYAVDALDYLKHYHKGENQAHGHVGVIGGGDVAMDCARAAMRGGADKVSIIYRRTQAFMPAEPEELREAREDGVEIIELLSPVSYDGKILTTEVMVLGDVGADGRRKVKGTGKTKQLAVDYLISATGSRVETDMMVKNGMVLDEGGYVVQNKHFETNIENVYVAGDCRKGPETIVRAMADGKTVAKDILSKLGLPNDFIAFKPAVEPSKAYGRKGVLKDASDDVKDGERCLACGQVCELCVDVCPNRANKAVKLSDGRVQIVHLDGMCNECGNCAVFCPYDGKPYMDKLTIYTNQIDFENSENNGFYMLEDGSFNMRMDGDSFNCVLNDVRVDKDVWETIKCVLAEHAYVF